MYVEINPLRPHAKPPPWWCVVLLLYIYARIFVTRNLSPEDNRWRFLPATSAIVAVAAAPSSWTTAPIIIYYSIIYNNNIISILCYGVVTIIYCYNGVRSVVDWVACPEIKTSTEKSRLYVAGDVVRASGSTVFEDRFARHEWVRPLDTKMYTRFNLSSSPICTGALLYRSRLHRRNDRVSTHCTHTRPCQKKTVDSKDILWLMWCIGYVGIVLLYLCLPLYRVQRLFYVYHSSLRFTLSVLRD